MPTADDYRRKAAEFRHLAEREIALDVKSTFKHLANTYERLAETADAGVPRKQSHRETDE